MIFLQKTGQRNLLPRTPTKKTRKISIRIGRRNKKTRKIKSKRKF